ncbi:MAG: type II toxin-antitoxin system RelE/ParE family toxin [Fimbriiglobus sp.]
MNIIRHSDAKSDIEYYAGYFYKTASLKVMDRFLSATDDTMERLADMPGIGVPLLVPDASLQGLRHHPIKGFPKHYIFYLETQSGIEVVRVIHAMRDLASQFRAS